jgi:hypothetical protein
MRKYIVGAIAALILCAGGVAVAAVTVILTGPATYADPQWRSVTINNKNGGTTYHAIVDVCPSSSNPAIPGACSITEIEVGSLPSSAQTIVNYMITQWCTAHPGYCI